jgi:hypothetical protein
MKADVAGSARHGLCVPLAGSRFGWERLNPTACAGNVFLDEDIGRYYLLSTGFTLVHLVNSEVLELQTGKASEGRFLNTCRYRSPIGDGSPLAGSGQVGLVTASAKTLNSSPSPCPYRHGVPDATSRCSITASRSATSNGLLNACRFRSLTAR